jgi:hypothetical protein
MLRDARCDARCDALSLPRSGDHVKVESVEPSPAATDRQPLVTTGSRKPFRPPAPD